MGIASVLAAMRLSGKMTDPQSASRFTGLVIVPTFMGHRNLRKNIDHKYGRRCYCLRGGVVADTVSAEAESEEFSA